MEQVKNLQLLIGAKPDGNFGRNTAKAYSNFMQWDFSEATHYLSQCMHESRHFSSFYENMNYSASALLEVFGKYFNPEEAKRYERNPEMIANKVYANRLGNGDEASGDGWKYRGFGAIQLTGKKNQNAFADSVGDPEIKQRPEKIAEDYAFNASEWFFDVNGIWRYCGDLDYDSIIKVSRAVNLGNANSTRTPNRMKDRVNCYKTIESWLKS